MGQTVYVDLYFLINFSMDFLCFFLTAKLLDRRLSVGRGLIGAALGGLYADLSLFLSFGYGLSLLLDILACGVMCAVVFGERNRLRSLPLYILVYTAISMALGGVMTALFHLFNRSSLFEGVEQTESDGISVWVFAALALLSAGITLLGGRFFRKRTSRRHAEVEVIYGGRSLRLHAMADSGNLLREPLGGRPCIVADMTAMERVLPRELIAAAKEEIPPIEAIRANDAKNLRLVPTKTASGEGVLLGVRMERITVDSGDGPREVDALVVLAKQGIGFDGSEALIPTGLLV